MSKERSCAVLKLTDRDVKGQRAARSGEGWSGSARAGGADCGDFAAPPGALGLPKPISKNRKIVVRPTPRHLLSLGACSFFKNNLCNQLLRT